MSVDDAVIEKMAEELSDCQDAIVEMHKRLFVMELKFMQLAHALKEHFDLEVPEMEEKS